MGVLPIILMFFFIRESSAYNIKKLRWANKYIDDAIIRFDEQGNTYFGDGKKLYKITASDQINAIEGEFKGYSRNQCRDVMQVSNRGDVFMLDRDTLMVLKAGSRKSKKVAEPVLEFHVDNNDNLFYVEEEKHDPPSYTLNINMIRPNSATPVQILKSTDFRLLYKGSSVVIKSDKSGNIYMSMHFRESNAILVLTNETLQEKQPVAKFVNITEAGTGRRWEIYDFMIDDKSNVWIFCRNDDSDVVMKLINDTWTEILRLEKDPGFSLHDSRLLNIKGRIFIVVRGTTIIRPRKNMSHIYYIASNDKVFKLTGSDSLSRFWTSVKWTADDEGQIYFYDHQNILTLKPNETQLVPVEIDEILKFVVVDWKNNVWIVASMVPEPRLYHLKKGKTIPELIDDRTQNCELPITFMAANFVTKKIYLSCFDTLYSIDNIN